MVWVIILPIFGGAGTILGFMDLNFRGKFRVRLRMTENSQFFGGREGAPYIKEGPTLQVLEEQIFRCLGFTNFRVRGLGVEVSSSSC